MQESNKYLRDIIGMTNDCNDIDNLPNMLRDLGQRDQMQFERLCWDVDIVTRLNLKQNKNSGQA